MSDLTESDPIHAIAEPSREMALGKSPIRRMIKATTHWQAWMPLPSFYSSFHLSASALAIHAIIHHSSCLGSVSGYVGTGSGNGRGCCDPPWVVERASSGRRLARAGIAQSPRRRVLAHNGAQGPS